MMKLPLAQTIVFVLAGLLIAAALFWVSDTLSPVYSADKRRLKKLRQYANEIEAINVGNSHNRAVDYEAMELRGFHLWKPGSDMFEVYYLLNAVVPLLPNLKVVLITISPMSFKFDNGFDESRHGMRREYYAITPTIRSWRPIHGDMKNLIKGKLAPLVREDCWRGVVDSILVNTSGDEREKQKAAVMNAVDEYGYIGLHFEKRMKRGIETDRSQELLNLIRKSEEIFRGNPKIAGEVYETAAATVQMLRQRDIRVIFFSPPVTQLANELFAGETPTTALAKQYIQRLEKEFGIEYYDFSQDHAFAQKYEYFFNEDHMNKSGARIFSRRLAEICGFAKVAKM